MRTHCKDISPSKKRETILFKLKNEPIVDEDSGIVLFPFDGGEAPWYEVWFKDPKVTKYLSISISSNEFVSRVTQNPRCAYYRIIHPLYGFIGHGSLKEIDMQQMTCERSIVIGETAYWNKGIGTRVGEMLIRRATELGFQRMRAEAHQDNIASVRNLTKQFGPGVSNEGGNTLVFEHRLHR
jgi:RimJ/RimL family protein N-acetyltransferase